MRDGAEPQSPTLAGGEREGAGHRAAQGTGHGTDHAAEGGTASPPAPVLLETAAGDGWSLRRLERAYILHILQRNEGHRGHTADALGIDRRTLYRKLKEYETEAG